jgi:hypothetical protein
MAPEPVRQTRSKTMRPTLKQFASAAVITAALTFLPACPPEEPAEEREVEPQRFDFKEFWPMQVGNQWHMQPEIVNDEAYYFVYEVLQDLSTEKMGGWFVDYRILDEDGNTVDKDPRYYVLREDFFAVVYNKDTFEAIMNDPEAPLPEDGISIIAPRYAYDRMPPQAFGETARGRSRFSEVTELLSALRGNSCLDPIDLHSDTGLPVPSEHQVLATLVEADCSGRPYFSVRDVFGHGVGPLLMGRRLDFAIVNGVVYANE